MSIKVTNNSKLVLKGLEELKKKAVNTQSLMLQIAEDMKTKTDMRFRHSKDPNGVAWEPLKESTVSRRRKGSSKPLVDTGELRGSISSKILENLEEVSVVKLLRMLQSWELIKNMQLFKTLELKKESLDLS